MGSVRSLRPIGQLKRLLLRNRGMRVAICETRLKPRLLPMISSKDSNVKYITIPSTLWNDPVCDCPGFQFRGSCRHVLEVEADKCEWAAKWHEMPENHRCPKCGAPAIFFELDPED